MPRLVLAEESGFLEGPVAVTNTHGVGVVRDAIIAWPARRGVILQRGSLPLISGNGSGDIFVAFSTANPEAAGDTVQATAEAIVNALVAAETMVGADGHRRRGGAARPSARGPAALRPAPRMTAWRAATRCPV